jgi:hypothetical protein
MTDGQRQPKSKTGVIIVNAGRSTLEKINLLIAMAKKD